MSKKSQNKTQQKKLKNHNKTENKNSLLAHFLDHECEHHIKMMDVPVHWARNPEPFPVHLKALRNALVQRWFTGQAILVIPQEPLNSILSRKEEGREHGKDVVSSLLTNKLRTL
jgi:hypothetical protein